MATGNKRQATIMFLVACLLSHVAWAAVTKPRIFADLDRSQITIGDRITLTLKVDAPEGSQIIFPDIKNRLGDLEVKGTHRGKNALSVTLTSYTVGSFAVPILSTKVISPNGEETVLETLQLFVEVKSVMKEGEEATDIRDIKGIVTLPGFFLSVWVLVAVCVLAGLATWLIFKRKKILPQVPALPPPPHMIALEALDRIDAQDLAGRDVKEYHFLVSQVLRRYLEGRFGVNAPDKTTEEFLETTSKNHILNESQKALLKSFLEQCDLVKFAKWTPPGDEARRISHIARGFIHQTKPEAEETENRDGIR